MKKIMSVLLMCIMVVSFVACGSEGHEGEAKTPSGSSIQKGRNYEDVLKTFQEKGFTNISLVPLDDLITGWLTKEGEVESVSVDGNVDYSADKWYPNDVEVIITYHTLPSNEKDSQNDVTEETTVDETDKVTDDEKTEEIIEDEKILTIDTCSDLKILLSIDAEIDTMYSEFAKTYKNATILFDGCITYVVNHDNYDTRYDILLSGGDYVDENTSNLGPTFKFEDVNTYNLGIESLSLPSFVKAGTNVRVTAIVQSFNENTGVFLLKPVLIEER